jgi:hypothetical protein
VVRDFAGDTIAVTQHAPRRERPGFGCPCCGTVLELEGRDILKRLAAGSGLACCGYTPTPGESVRWVRAARLLATGHAAH